MEFVVEGSQGNCVRLEADENTGRVQRQVAASFDAHLGSVAPHVAACLNPDEVMKLEAWLSERRKLQARKALQALLESIPELLSRAESAVREQGTVSEALLPSLRESLSRFSRVLEGVETTTQEAPPAIEEMNNSEVLKERIDIVRKDL